MYHYAPGLPLITKISKKFFFKSTCSNQPGTPDRPSTCHDTTCNVEVWFNIATLEHNDSFETCIKTVNKRKQNETLTFLVS